ncbi:holo-ACP synthase [Undibacterium jejuense]|uniref:Holo-[acyl-carrier-protein] synthase n=1 Tax=Undibacterium jejuense TaxID=1344949 RepID=A0A923HJ58_9BURK|nr:holo-ACP synthase [Undibacterium jejuense]
MIYGVGTDIVEVARIERALQRGGDRFAKKVLGDEELLIFFQRRDQALARGIRYLATRFAAKEAFSKAIGTGVRLPMTLRNMQTLNGDQGKPVVVVSDDLEKWMSVRNLTAHVSVSDEVQQVLAFVVVEQAATI